MSIVLLLLLSGCPWELRVFDVEPDAIVAGESVTLDIVGTGFDDSTTFRIHAPGIEVTLGDVVIQSETSVQTRVPASVPPGTYALHAFSGINEASLEDALTVYSQAATVIFLDVGQGDATIVIAPEGETLLIDGGKTNRGDSVNRALDEYAGGRLDAVVLSHYDADHLGGLVHVLSGTDGRPGTTDDRTPLIAYAPTDDGSCTTDICAEFRQLNRVDFAVPSVGDVFQLGALDVEIVAVDGRVGGASAPSGLDDNARSLAVQIIFGGRRVLVLGDLTGGGKGTVDLETPLSEQTGPVDVVRVAHHGSATSSPQSAIANWQAQVAVFSMGTDNAYCHPSEDVLQRWSAATPSLWATGAGIVETSTQCEEQTSTLGSSQFGVGDIVLDISVDGAMTMNGEGLP